MCGHSALPLPPLPPANAVACTNATALPGSLFPSLSIFMSQATHHANPELWP